MRPTISIQLSDAPPSSLGRLAKRLSCPAWLVAAVGLCVVLQRLTQAAGVALDVRLGEEAARRLVMPALPAAAISELAALAQDQWRGSSPVEEPAGPRVALLVSSTGREGLRFELASDLSESVWRVPGPLAALLDWCARLPDPRPWEAPLVSEAAVPSALALLRSERADVPADLVVPELVGRQAAERPDAPAVRHGGRTMTYREMDAVATGLASYLGEMGVAPGGRVVLYLRRSAALPVAALGAMRCGAAYTPIDPAQPPARTGLMIREARAAAIVTVSELLDDLADVDAEVVALDDVWDLSARRGTGGPPIRVSPDHPAYVIYTSGSTGVPKGTVLTHRTLLNYVWWYRRRYGVGPADRVAVVVSPAFDVSVSDLWPTLTAGACLDMIDDDQRLDPPGLWSWLDERETTLLFAPTPLGEAFLDLESSPRALRTLVVGGDRLDRRPRPNHRFEVSNVYGPAETTIGASESSVEPDGLGLGRPHIGHPIANVALSVLDAGGNLVPPGFPGELYIGGAGVGLGYQWAPALTAERYVPDRYATVPGARAYRTGDLVGYDDDGTLQYFGRLDDQVKIRGFRIELGEIQAVLRAEVQVSAAVVTPTPAPGGGHRLTAYVVSGAQPVPDLTELRTRLARRLPEHMVPSALVVLDALPLSGSGKVDRRKLPPPQLDQRRAAAPGRVLTPTEQRVASVWADALGLPSVGADDDFFDLGGHSLIVAEVTERLARELRLAIPITTLRDHRTVAAFSAALERVPHGG